MSEDTLESFKNKPPAEIEIFARKLHITSEIRKKALNIPELMDKIKKEINAKLHVIEDAQIESFVTGIDMRQLYSEIPSDKYSDVIQYEHDIKTTIFGNDKIKEMIFKSKESIDKLNEITRENVERNGGDEGTRMRKYLNYSFDNGLGIIWKRRLIKEAYDKLNRIGYKTLHEQFIPMGCAVFGAGENVSDIEARKKGGFPWAEYTSLKREME